MLIKQNIKPPAVKRRMIVDDFLRAHFPTIMNYHARGQAGKRTTIMKILKMFKVNGS